MRAAIATLGVVLISSCLVPTLGGAAGPEGHALLDGTVRFLQASQQEDGGFGEASGSSSQSISAWVSLALAATGINPRNQAKPCGTDAYTYLVESFRRQAETGAPIATTDLVRELLVVNVAGSDPHDFAGIDLVEEILARQLPDGSFLDAPGGESKVNATIFAILGLSPVEEPSIPPAIRRAAHWLITQQNGDGGWFWSTKGPASEVDMTGAAIQALNVTGRPVDPVQLAAFEAAHSQALDYLRDAQLPDGGFPALPHSEHESNVASTAWAVQAIWSAGGNPETWRTGSGLATEEPLDYMESLQQPDGHIRWKKSADTNGVWMTAYVVPAAAGHALPIPEAPYSNTGMPSCGAERDGSQIGVTAGGGGHGAPFFSRPKPQSKGKTPGGARIVRNKNLRPHNHSKSRRGSNAAQPSGTATAEPREADAPSEREETAVSSSAGPGTGSGAEETNTNNGGGDDAGAQSRSGETGVMPPSPELSELAQTAASGSAGQEVSGVVIGSLDSSQGGKLTFGAPGLRSADSATDGESWVAAAIGAMALLLALGGARWERRHEEVLP